MIRTGQFGWADCELAWAGWGLRLALGRLGRGDPLMCSPRALLLLLPPVTLPAGVFFSTADFHPLVDSITYSDYYLLANDFEDYIQTNVSVWRVLCG